MDYDYDDEFDPQLKADLEGQASVAAQNAIVKNLFFSWDDLTP